MTATPPDFTTSGAFSLSPAGLRRKLNALIVIRAIVVTFLIGATALLAPRPEDPVATTGPADLFLLSLGVAVAIRIKQLIH